MLEKWDRRVFTRSPFENAQTAFYAGKPRKEVEQELVEICAGFPAALRLVVAMGFRPRFLLDRNCRTVWKWLLRPKYRRHIEQLHLPDWPDMILIAADVHHRERMIHAHGEHRAAEYYSESRPLHHDRCLSCVAVYRRELANALAIAAHLMREHERGVIVPWRCLPRCWRKGHSCDRIKLTIRRTVMIDMDQLEWMNSEVREQL